MNLEKYYKNFKDSLKVYYRNFLSSLKNSRSVQETILKDIVFSNKESQFGKINDFSNIKTIQDFQKIPIKEYDDYYSYIEKIINGEKNVLTTEDPIILQPTSGSVSKKKLIPFTKNLKNEFQNAIFAWLYDLLDNNPKIKKGRWYFSITPSIKIDIKSKIPIGFLDDFEYFNKSQMEALSNLSISISETQNISSKKHFKDITLKHLLKAKDLSFISVWHPTFLSVLMEGIDCKNVFKDLALISCWTEGNSSIHLNDIKKMFPGVKIQKKGLMSTEAICSIPLALSQDCILAINSHFFEFRDFENNMYLPHQTKKNKLYEIIVTTSGGLYRYATNDIVEVTNHINDCPTIKFIGRNNNVCDFVGEKLNELHVEKIIKANLKKFKIKPDFIMLSAEKEKNGIRYFLHIKSKQIVSKKFIEAIENGLKENFHYDYAIKLGQIYPLALNEIKISNPIGEFIKKESQENKKQGTIKCPFLHKSLGWKKVLR